ncbi:MAG: glycosyltransferase family 2 protein [Verrucomicrobiia bacterium]
MLECTYVVVSPTRDEENHLPKTIASLAGQTVKPKWWVIVDDGSKDQTGAIADDAAAQHPWIRVIHRQDRGFRQAGGGVIDAFYAGLAAVDAPWDFLVKLDADLSFGPHYFEKCLRHFMHDPRLGIGGGTVCQGIDGQLQCESKIDPTFHVRGATKIYRRECWDQIEPLIRCPGWDTVDEVKANMLGWRTMTFSELRVEHHRLTGQAYGAWNDWVKGGRGNYIAGYHPLFMLVKCFKRLFYRPFVLGGAGLFWGYANSWVRGLPRVNDEELIRYFRNQQLNRLMLRKSLWSLMDEDLSLRYSQSRSSSTAHEASP